MFKTQYMRLFFLMMVLATVGIVGCAGNSKEPVGNKSSNMKDEGKADKTQEATVSLEIADLEKVDSWELQAKSHAKLTEVMVDVMNGITDKTSAEASIDKFKKLAAQFAALARAELRLGKATADVRKEAMKIIDPANGKFNVAYHKLSGNDELFAIVKDALDKAYVGEEF